MIGEKQQSKEDDRIPIITTGCRVSEDECDGEQTGRKKITGRFYPAAQRRNNGQVTPL